MTRNSSRRASHSTEVAKPQSGAFLEAAHVLGCDVSEERFDAALKKVAAHKRAQRLSSLDDFWERARIAAEKDGYKILSPSFPISQPD
jgi:hypothetical protein